MKCKPPPRQFYCSHCRSWRTDWWRNRRSATGRQSWCARCMMAQYVIRNILRYYARS